MRVCDFSGVGAEESVTIASVLLVLLYRLLVIGLSLTRSSAAQSKDLMAARCG